MPQRQHADYRQAHSLGVHNPAYTKALIEAGLEALGN
jgi:hypothetical protein